MSDRFPEFEVMCSATQGMLGKTLLCLKMEDFFNIFTALGQDDCVTVSCTRIFATLAIQTDDHVNGVFFICLDGLETVYIPILSHSKFLSLQKQCLQLCHVFLTHSWSYKVRHYTYLFLDEEPAHDCSSEAAWPSG